jgi:hypothetical protein
VAKVIQKIERGMSGRLPTARTKMTEARNDDRWADAFAVALPER